MGRGTPSAYKNTIILKTPDGEYALTYFIVRAHIPTPEIDIMSDMDGYIEEYEERI